jgi:hypothetical protein
MGFDRANQLNLKRKARRPEPGGLSLFGRFRRAARWEECRVWLQQR